MADARDWLLDRAWQHRACSLNRWKVNFSGDEMLAWTAILSLSCTSLTVRRCECSAGPPSRGRIREHKRSPSTLNAETHVKKLEKENLHAIR
jgi:hypothetical protein